MQKECVTPEVAKKLKASGFDEQCLHYYDPEDEFCSFEYFDCDRTNSSLQSDYGGVKECTAPLWQQAIRWLQEQHGIIVCPTPYTEFWDGKVTGFYMGEIIHTDGPLLCEGDSNYPTYEEARETAILEALKHVKQQ